MTDIKKIELASMANLTKTKDWYAWLNLMPPAPNDFHVIGDVLVPNPGVRAMLIPKEPQVVDRRILLMDLYLIQQPGYWIQVVNWIQAKYDRVVKGKPYEKVQIFSDGRLIADIPVEEVH